MDKKVEFKYGNTLSDIMKKIVGCDEAVDMLGDIAKESWNLARKITEYMEV